VSAALDELRAELDKLPPLYPSRRVLDLALAEMLALELRVANLEQILVDSHTPRLDD
jgi:hypothetical protein